MMSSYIRAFGARVFAMASNLVSGVVSLRLYRHLTPEAYGVVVVALTAMSYLPLLDGGFRTTLNRTMLAEPDRNQRRRLLRFGQIFYSWLGVGMLAVALLLMLVYAFTPPGRSSGQPLWFFVSLAVAGALAVVGSIQSGVLIGLQAQAYYYVLMGVGSWLSLTGLWLVLTRGGGVWAFPASTLLIVLGTYPFALWLMRRREPSAPLISFRVDPEFWEQFRRLRGDAWHCFRSQTSIVFLYTIDIILVGQICTTREAAIYAIVSRMFAILRGFLQAMSEISWPFIAQRGWGKKQRILNRMNAWAVGSVTGAVCLTIGPFCPWYVGHDWAVPQSLVWLIAARFLVTSLAAPAAYVLYGTGDFRAISRCLNRELVLGVGLGLVLGVMYGVSGVAWAFLLSTAAGTLLPIYRAYADRTGESAVGALTEIWSRAVAGLTISIVCTKLTLGYFATGGQLILAGAAGLAGGLAGCVAWSLVRMLRDNASVAPTTVLRFMNSI